MDHSEKFSDYLFAKMGPPIIGTMDAECAQKTTDNCDAPPFEFTGFRKWLNENLMLLVTLSGVLLGVILGFSLRPLNLTEDSIMLISYPGELFMRLLKLMILPLVISSLIAGSASLNARMNGRIALRTLIYFASTSFFNAFLGICLVLLISPGTLDDKRLTSDSSPVVQTSTTNLLDSLLDLGRNVFPDNLFQASFQQAHTVYVAKKPSVKMFSNTKMENISTSTISPLVQLFVTSSTNDNLTSIINSTIKPIIEYLTPSSQLSQEQEIHRPEMIRELQYRPGTNTLGIVFFCLVFGTLLGTIGNKGQVVIDFFTAVFDVVMKMVTSVMWLTPLGISSVIAGKILSVTDLATVMSQLMWFIITVAIGVFFYQLIVMQLIYFVFLRRNPFKFYCGLIYPMLTAFATASTAAALPVTFRCMHDKLKIDPRITRFVLPIGCNINMDGTALFISVASIFIAQMSGMELGLGELVTVLLTSTATSMSSASVPSAALVLLLVVLSAIDAPVHNVTLLFAIDWFVDRIRTTNNMLGDCYAAAVVEELSKKELMALDASILYPDTPVTPNGHCLINCQSSDLDRKISLPDSVIVEMNNNNNNNNGIIQPCCVSSGQCNTIIIGPSPSTTLGSSSTKQPSQLLLSSSSSSSTGLSLQTTTTTTTTTTTSTINGGIPSVGMGNNAKIQTINK